MTIISVTRDDVAKRAGVSPAVVSYVINNSNYVRSEKRKAVLQAIQDLQYRPNMIARSMKTRRSYYFAIVADDIRNEMFMEYLSNIERFSFDKGYSVSLCSARYDNDFIHNLLARQYDGIFMTSNGFSCAQMQVFYKAKIPLVLFQSRMHDYIAPEVTVLNIDFKKTSMLAIDHLFSLGHRRIAYIPPYLYKSEQFKRTGFREMGYIEGLQKNCLPLDDRLFCNTVSTYEAICRWVIELIRLSRVENNPVTAFIISNDTVAAIVLKALHQEGISVPGEISLVGMDNTFSSSITNPTITSIDSDKLAFSMAIVDKLVDKINGLEVSNKCFDVRLIQRQSVKPLSC